MDRKQDIASACRRGEGYDVRAIARRLAISAVMGVSAYFAGLAELPFGARPFGVALLAASRRDAIFVYLGLIVSAFTALDADEAVVYFAVYSALLLLRVFSRFIVEIRDASELRLGARRMLSTVFRESVGLRILSSAVFGFLFTCCIPCSGRYLPGSPFLPCGRSRSGPF